MATTKTAGPWVAALALALAAGACDAPDESTTGQIEIFSWWTAQGEADALEALVAHFQNEYPNQMVINSAATGSMQARETLQSRLVQGRPPDTFQANGGRDLFTWVRYGGSQMEEDSKIESIDDLASAERWAEVIPAPVLSTVQDQGHTYAVPLNIHRLNVLFYSPKVFADHGLTVPTTLDELFQVSEEIKRLNAGRDNPVMPIAIGMEDPWTLLLVLFENLLVARAGGQHYWDFFRLAQDPFESPEIALAIEDLRRLISYVNLDIARLQDWTKAADMVIDGKAAMTIMGDWARGYYVAKGKVAGVDFEQRLMPGTESTFVFTTDTFGLPKGARNRRGALELLKVMGSQPGQEAFNPIKGSIPARNDTNPDDPNIPYDEHAKETIRAFKAAAASPDHLVPANAILAPPDYVTAIKTALAEFVADRNASRLMHAMRNWRDALQQ